MHTQQPTWQCLLYSLLFRIGVCYANSLSIEGPVEALLCQSQSSPNPIASTYPTNATGTLNGTIAVIPIALDLARQMIPSQYRIMEHAYRALLPFFPKNMYPAFLQAVHDHDVQASGLPIPDFSVVYGIGYHRTGLLMKSACWP